MCVCGVWAPPQGMCGVWAPPQGMLIKPNILIPQVCVTTEATTTATTFKMASAFTCNKLQTVVRYLGISSQQFQT